MKIIFLITIAINICRFSVFPLSLVTSYDVWREIRRTSLTRCWWHRVHAFKPHHGKIKQSGKSLVSVRMRRVKQRGRWKTRAWRTRNCVRRSILHIPGLPWRTTVAGVCVYTRIVHLYVRSSPREQIQEQIQEQKVGPTETFRRDSFRGWILFSHIVVFLHSQTVFSLLTISEFHCKFCCLVSRNRKIVML